MSSEGVQPATRGEYLAIASASTFVALGLTVGVALMLGAEVRTASLAGLVIAIASIASFLPAFLKVSPLSWGLLVVGSSIARMLMVMGLGLILDTTQELDRRPYWMAIVLGAIFALIAETAFAVWALSRAEKLRVSHTSTNARTERTSS